LFNFVFEGVEFFSNVRDGAGYWSGRKIKTAAASGLVLRFWGWEVELCGLELVEVAGKDLSVLQNHFLV
jgi:hypothetical protein